MKSLLLKSCLGLFALFCITLVFSSFTPADAATVHKYKAEKVIKHENATVAAVSIMKLLLNADVPANLKIAKPECTGFSYPINDEKPDNTNYQLIRQNQLKLHTATDSQSM